MGNELKEMIKNILKTWGIIPHSIYSYKPNNISIHFKSKGNLKVIRQDLQDRQDTGQH